MIEVLDLHETEFWKERVAHFKTWYKCLEGFLDMGVSRPAARMESWQLEAMN